MNAPEGFEADERANEAARRDFLKRLVQAVPAKVPLDYCGTKRIANQPVDDKGCAVPVWHGNFTPVEQESLGVGCRRQYYEDMKAAAKENYKFFPYCLDMKVTISGNSNVSNKRQ
ncbi:unnamed protein product [Bursaphelenchus okinawaensis]|uniref:Uncharacterized protein n=1 Tax=Bursaphelenchus okinawaensis TaxID=465554 RepID=A0A811JVK4_9BILA|nr:unnamed protein product [Bursaphelenchus okinawaensis]CAG9085918.1 unnamed protein product [Bursaphelenchus okinawaensis]